MTSRVLGMAPRNCANPITLLVCCAGDRCVTSPWGGRLGAEIPVTLKTNFHPEATSVTGRPDDYNRNVLRLVQPRWPSAFA